MLSKAIWNGIDSRSSTFEGKRARHSSSIWSSRLMSASRGTKMRRRTRPKMKTMSRFQNDFVLFPVSRTDPSDRYRSEEEDWSARLRRNGVPRNGTRRVADRERRNASPNGTISDPESGVEDDVYVPRVSNRSGKRKRTTRDEEDDEEGEETTSPTLQDNADEIENGENNDTANSRGEHIHREGGRFASRNRKRDRRDRKRNAPEPDLPSTTSQSNDTLATDTPTDFPQLPKPPPSDTVSLRFSITCQSLLKSPAAAKTTPLKLLPTSTELCSAFLSRVCPRLVKGFPDRLFFLATVDPVLAGAEEGVRFEGTDVMGEIVGDLGESRTLYICCEVVTSAEDD